MKLPAIHPLLLLMLLCAIAATTSRAAKGDEAGLPRTRYYYPLHAFLPSIGRQVIGANGHNVSKINHSLVLAAASHCHLLQLEEEGKDEEEEEEEEGERCGDLLTRLMTFLLSLTAGEQLYLVYDDAESEGLWAAERAWRQEGRTITLVEHDAEERLLVEVLKEARHRVLSKRNVLVLCAPEHVVTLFQQVKRHALESRSTQWFVVTNTDLRLTLPNELREGTQVALAWWLEDLRTARLYSSRMHPDGEIRFSFVGEWKAGVLRASRETLITAGRGQEAESEEAEKADEMEEADEVEEAGDGGGSLIPHDTCHHRQMIIRQLVPNIRKVYSNLGGRHLVVTTNDNWPFIKIITLSNGTVIPVSGVDLRIINTLSQTLNFTYHLIRPPDGKWGGPQPDGTITGIIGQVARHEAHIAMCELTITILRETVVDFTVPYYLESSTLVSGAPREKSRTFAVFSPFALEVWACIVGVVVAVGPFLYFVTRLLVLFLDHRDDPRYTPMDLGFHMYRNLMIQSNLIRTSSWVLKLIFFSWYLFSFYISALYSGTLTAVLALPAFEVPIDSLDQLKEATQRGYTIGTTRDSSFEETLKTAKSGIYREVWLLMNHENPDQSFLPTPHSGIEMVLKKDKFVFIHAQIGSTMMAAQMGSQKFHIGRQTFLPQGYGIACTSGSPLQDVFSSYLRRISEAGLVSKWAGDEVSGRGSKRGTAMPSGPPVITIQHLQAAFILLSLGLAAAVVVLAGEIVEHKWGLLIRVRPAAGGRNTRRHHKGQGRSYKTCLCEDSNPCTHN